MTMKKAILWVLLLTTTAGAGLGDLGKLKSLVKKKDDAKKSEPASGEKKSSDSSSEPAEPTQPMNKPEDVDKGGDVRTLWHDAKVGQMVRSRMMNDMAMQTEVVEVKDRVVLIQTTTFQKDKPISRTLMYFPRFTKPAEAHSNQKLPEVKTTSLPEETLKIAGRDVPCKVTKTEMNHEGKTITTITWTSEAVPFQTVKIQNDALGKMQVISEVVDFRK